MSIKRHKFKLVATSIAIMMAGSFTILAAFGTLELEVVKMSFTRFSIQCVAGGGLCKIGGELLKRIVRNDNT